MKNLKNILLEINSVIERTNESEIDEAAETITEDKRIFVTGMGRNGLQGRAFAMRLMHIGYTSYFVGETITPAIKDEDILIAISGSGETGSILSICQKAIDAGAEIIAITSELNSSIGNLSSKSIIIPAATRSSKEKSSIQLLSTIFDQSVHLILDSLALKIANRDGVDDDFAKKMHSNLE